MLVDGRLNGGRLLWRAGYDDQPEAALADEGVELARSAASLNVSVALTSHVVWLAAKIDSDQIPDDRMAFGLVETMWRVQSLRRSTKDKTAQVPMEVNRRCWADAKGRVGQRPRTRSAETGVPEVVRDWWASRGFALRRPEREIDPRVVEA